MDYNEKRKQKLGMSISIARYKLVKQIVFKLLKELKQNFCYRCKKEIVNIGDLSIEHKIDWLNSEKPIELFFDLNNISFSHLKCNCQTPENIQKFKEVGLAMTIKSPEGMSWCSKCKQHKPVQEFYKSKNNHTRQGLTGWCKLCH